MFGEFVRLLVDTIWPHCLICGRRRCRFDDRRCTCPAHMLAIGAYRRGCPVHPR